QDLEARGSRARVSIGGIVSNYRERPLKSGTGRIVFFDLEDQFGQVEVLCFSKQFAEFGEVLKSEDPILVTGVVQMEGDDAANLAPKIRLEAAHLISGLRVEKTTRMDLTLPADTAGKEQLEKLRALLERAPGTCSVYVRLVIPKRSE